MGWLGVALGLAAIAVPGLIAGAALGCIGFGVAGIVKGSAAAGLHSAIGIVSTPGIFPTLQSAAMGGYGAAIVNGVIQVVGGLVALVSALFT
ncbi:hypothetical protein F4821DRAFT_240256 [Hypoxylon rubiginosum]|uniref:Uncharacterized protein n=1 Tax=Hypoxylon rubiginosum TaxID=110542 RepID=A0ACC0CZ01_9PEZI|nr:hypothetical protein F4821DRAFT_240256 [Hypoxylon rubiginosum]